MRDLAKRLELLHAMHRGLKETKDDFLKALTDDLGKPGPEADITEWHIVLKETEAMIKGLPRWTRKRRKSQPLGLWPGKSFLRYDPHGKVLIYAPWNYPMQLALAPVVGAIAAGNTVTLKPSEHAPACADYMKSFAERYLSERVDVKLGNAEVASGLLEEDWDFIFFTGSPNIGRIVLRACAEKWIPSCVELGGSNPCVMLEPFAAEVAARRISWAKLLNAGQTCVAPNHLLVPKNRSHEFFDILSKRFHDIAPVDANGHPELMGHIVHERHYQNLQKQDEWWRERAAKSFQHGSDDPSQNLLVPKLHLMDGNLRENLKQADEIEIFGPLLPVITYEDPGEIYEHYRKNPTHPLSLYVFTENHAEGKRWLEELKFGGGCLNDCVLHMAPGHLPFGGVRRSGIGNYHGESSFVLFSHEKAIFENSTWVDPGIRYQPYSKKKVDILRKLI